MSDLDLWICSPGMRLKNIGKFERIIKSMGSKLISGMNKTTLRGYRTCRKEGWNPRKILFEGQIKG